MTLSGSTGDEDFVLTNYHVAECKEMKTVMNKDRNPITPTHPLVAEEKIHFVSPADDDWESARNEYRSFVISTACDIGPLIGHPYDHLLQKKVR